MLCFMHIFFAIGAGYFHFFTGKNFSCAGNMVNFIFLKKKSNAFASPVRHIAAALYHCFYVRLRFFYIDSVVRSMTDVFKYLCALEQRLGGYTTPVKTDTAQFCFFYYSCF